LHKAVIIGNIVVVCVCPVNTERIYLETEVSYVKPWKQWTEKETNMVWKLW